MSADRIPFRRSNTPLRTRLVALAASIVAVLLIQLTAVPPAAAGNPTAAPGQHRVATTSRWATRTASACR